MDTSTLVNLDTISQRSRGEVLLGEHDDQSYIVEEGNQNTSISVLQNKIKTTRKPPFEVLSTHRPAGLDRILGQKQHIRAKIKEYSAELTKARNNLDNALRSRDRGLLSDISSQVKAVNSFTHMVADYTEELEELECKEEEFKAQYIIELDLSRLEELRSHREIERVAELEKQTEKLAKNDRAIQELNSIKVRCDEARRIKLAERRRREQGVSVAVTDDLLLKISII